MSRIYVSLLLTALLTLFLLGWGIDRWVEEHRDTPNHQDYTHLSQLFEGLRHNLDTSRDLPQQVALLAAALPLQLSLEGASDLALPGDLKPALQQPGGLLLESSDGPYLLASLPGHPQYLLKLALPPLQPTDSERDLLLTLSLYSGLAVMMGIWLLPLTRRLSLLTHVASRFGKGELQARVPPSRTSYVAELEHSFNQMAQRIEQLIAENRLLASSLSHDLRTPLACFRFGLDAALDSNDLAEKNQYLQRLEADLERMEKMLAAFLDFASLERQGTRIQRQRLDLTELLQTNLQAFAPLASQHRAELTAKLPERTLLLTGDSHWLSRAITNVLANGARFAKGKLQVTLDEQGDWYRVTIEDNGPGIEPSQKDNILKPFVSLQHCRQSGSYGLGLAIVERVLSWHDGRIQVDRSDLGGARFRLLLPKSVD
ncbi:ATP-binding protein [Bowmanella dokdonensis]|uniref:histidine kinase n=1 Tax=Bowmanella dokdonensis TaxID=751969 RepID=A0A939IRD5_9ALTE|nr:ATP-binding protein [Bowmanella dokdonensis]MBN7825391.1 HAMP domain-containing protein [Bowmanella dokdonensis]